MTTSPKRSRTQRNHPNSSGKTGSAGQVRIIAGRWRGRKLSVPDVQGLRPTGDRVRETLFNWLQGEIAGAHCLDLFAGSGALGFEALSRYAQSVTFVEPDPGAYRNLGDSCQLLDVRNTNSLAPDNKVFNETSPELTASDEHTVHERVQPDIPAPTAQLFAGTAQNALDYWADVDTAPAFDLVFIDPPFQMGCQWTILRSLAQQLLIAPDALVYLEAPANQSIPEHLPSGCNFVREKRFGDVMARLVRYTGPQ